MFIMDAPYVPAQDAPIVLAQADVAAETPPPADFILNVCKETFHTPDSRSAFRGVDPAFMLKNYFGSFGYTIELADIKTTLLQGTQHGNIFGWTDNAGLTSYHYDPTPGIYGDDQAVFMAEYAGKNFKIVVQIKVTKDFNENDPQCSAPVMIKATKPSSGDSGYGSGYNLAAVNVTFADFAGAALSALKGPGAN